MFFKKPGLSNVDPTQSDYPGPTNLSQAMDAFLDLKLMKNVKEFLLIVEKIFDKCFSHYKILLLFVK